MAWSFAADSANACSFLRFCLAFDRSVLGTIDSVSFGMLFLCPRCSVGTQSMLNLSQSAAGRPETKCLQQTLSF